jgi:hypothetical protein
MAEPWLLELVFSPQDMWSRIRSELVLPKYFEVSYRKTYVDDGVAAFSVKHRVMVATW